MTSYATAKFAHQLTHAPGGPADLSDTYTPSDWLLENVKRHGAKGDGVTDDSAAIASALSVRGAIFLPGSAGAYVYDDAALSGFSNPVIVGDGKQASVLQVANSDFFIDDSAQWESMLVQGMTFTGGKGHFRNTFAGTNVHGKKTIRDCEFLQHTGCSISSEALDEPYWTFQNSIFKGANLTTSMHIALSGYADSCVFDTCSFLDARIQVKLRAMYTARFIDCDFIPITSGGAGNRVQLWIVPQATIIASFGSISGTKFGAENSDAGDLHILIADEGSGTYVGDKLPSASASTGTVLGLTVNEDCLFSNAGPSAAPFIYSRTNDLQECHVAGMLYGTAPASIIQYASPSTGNALDRLHETNVIGPITQSTISEGVVPLMTNSGAVHAIDPAHKLAAGDPLVELPGMGDAGGVIKLLSTAISGYSAAGATVSAGTDTLGGSNETEVTFSAANTGLFAYASPNPTVGKLIWVEFEAAQGSTSSLVDLDVWVGDDNATTGGPLYFRRRVTLQPTLTQYRFCFSVTHSVSNTYLFFTTRAAGKAKIGRAALYHSRAPVPRDAVGFASGAKMIMGTGVPASGVGSNGDFFFRTDGTQAAHTLIYHKEAGAWVATAA